MTELSVPALSVDDLATRTGVADLATRLEASGIRLVRWGEDILVLSDDWYAYLGTTIRASDDAPRRVEPSPDGDARHPHPTMTMRARDDGSPENMRDEAQPRSIIRDEDWDDYRRGMFGRYPWLADLLEHFVAHLAEQRPETVINQTRSTVTLILPNGGWAGIYPKPTQGGLRLRAIRKGEPHYEFVKTADDFDRVVAWLDGLPAYGD